MTSRLEGSLPFLGKSRHGTWKIDVLKEISVFWLMLNVLKPEHGKGKEFDAAGTREPENAR